jgi:hypothetical protein
MSYDPSQPRNDNGEWADAGASGGKKKRLPKMNIDTAAGHLFDRGWKLGKAQPWEPGKKISYEVTHIATGKSMVKTAQEILIKVTS